MNLLKREWGRMRGRIVYSWAGVCLAWKEEHSFRFWAYMNVVSTSLALALPLPLWSKMSIVCLGILILAAEAFNTAIERVVNHLSPDEHPLAKAAKDAGSAGVAIAGISAGIAWVFGVVSLL